MIDPNEALARIAIADFEARRLKERAAEQSRRFRLIFTFLRVVVLLGAGIVLLVSRWQVSGAQACWFLLIYLATSAWEDHRAGEAFLTLQAQVDRLKDEIERNLPNINIEGRVTPAPSHNPG